MTGAGRREAGSAGVLACGLVALIGVLVLGLGRVATAVVTAARAQTAADAAALAAAGELAAGRTAGDAERTASLTAAANGARLLRCDCGGPAVTVHVSVILPFPRPVSGLLRAAARAELHPECTG
ncbi:MAG TPA: Rv3654c family TadE-like protein [Acidimicrobiia bacterium]|nr:Rv3654c family TadE-like protein [Acidimicrobiia bacterium]